jgi:hypothetical protein
MSVYQVVDLLSNLLDNMLAQYSARKMGMQMGEPLVVLLGLMTDESWVGWKVALMVGKMVVWMDDKKVELMELKKAMMMAI